MMIILCEEGSSVQVRVCSTEYQSNYLTITSLNTKLVIPNRSHEDLSQRQPNLLCSLPDLLLVELKPVCKRVGHNFHELIYT